MGLVMCLCSYSPPLIICALLYLSIFLCSRIARCLPRWWQIIFNLRCCSVDGAYHALSRVSHTPRYIQWDILVCLFTCLLLLLLLLLFQSLDHGPDNDHDSLWVLFSPTQELLLPYLFCIVPWPLSLGTGSLRAVIAGPLDIASLPSRDCWP